MMIQSNQNPKIQRVRALLAKHKERQNQNCFVLEGLRLIEEAIQAGFLPDLLLYSNPSSKTEMLIDKATQGGSEIEEVKPSILESISDTKTSQGLIGVFKTPELPYQSSPDFLLIIDELSDPGNLGTILRTAAAAKVQLVILTPGTTDVYAPKVVRSAMGAHFYLPIRKMNWQEIFDLKQHSCHEVHFLASDMTGGKSCWESNLKLPVAVIIGSEATGISEQAMQLSDDQIHIPMQGRIESLNASTAASILIFEVVRQRKA